MMRLDEAQRQVQIRYAALFRAGQQTPADYADCCAFADGTVVCTAMIHDRLGAPPRRPLGLVDASGAFTALHAGPAKLPEPSQDGALLAFAVDGAEGDRLVIIAPDGAICAERDFAGRIEQIDWRADNGALLLVVADPETDTSTLAGSVTQRRNTDDGEPGRVHHPAPGARRIALFDPAANTVRTVPIDGTVWEAVWCGRDQAVGLWSADAGESGWYRPTLVMIGLADGTRQDIHRPRHQMGHVRANADGTCVAFVEAVASDRGLVAGTLMLCRGTAVQSVAAPDFDVSSVRWRDQSTLHLAGLRGLETVVGDFVAENDRFETCWASTDATCGSLLPVSRPFAQGQALAVVEAPELPPRPTILSQGKMVRLGQDEPCQSLVVSNVSWSAPDGTMIEGLLLRPQRATGVQGGLPLVIDVHGGPVWAWRPCWQGRLRSAPLLLDAGAAILLPNPRGSLGRGLAFAGAVLGENGGMGGPEIGDFEAAIDTLVRHGLVDPQRVGLTGSSYGGYIAAWLPKLRPDIAAAAPISPVTDWFSQHLASNMPALEEIFLGGRSTEIPERYLSRSPVFSPQSTQAPTLILAGERDRCVPLTQAYELHRALDEQGSTVELVTYPDEGHSLRGPAGYLDSAARVYAWMTNHLGLAPTP